MAMEEMAEMMGGSDEEPEAPLDDFAAAAQDAFPGETFTPERLDALKTAIRICVEDDAAGEYDKPSPGPKKGGVDLALILGAPKKKS